MVVADCQPVADVATVPAAAGEAGAAPVAHDDGAAAGVPAPAAPRPHQTAAQGGGGGFLPACWSTGKHT